MILFRLATLACILTSQLVLSQSDNSSLIYNVYEMVMNSTFPKANSVGSNYFTVCPFSHSFKPSDNAMVSVIETIGNHDMGCIERLLQDPSYCVFEGETNNLEKLSDVAKYRSSLNASWIYNTVENGSLPSIFYTNYTLSVSSSNIANPVTVRFKLKVDTSTGLWYPLMGGFGGSNKITLCDEGSFVTRINGHWQNGDYFRGLYIVCTDGSERLASELNQPGNKVTIQDCGAADYPISGVYSSLYDCQPFIFGMRFVCANKKNTAWIGAIDRQYKLYHMCPKGSLVNGLIVQSGQIIDGFALHCQQVPFDIGFADYPDAKSFWPVVLNESAPLILFNDAFMYAFIGYGGMNAIKLNVSINWGSSEGVLDVYRGNLWRQVRTGYVVTMNDVMNSTLRLRLTKLNPADSFPLVLTVNASTPMGHSKLVKDFVISVTRDRRSQYTSTSVYSSDPSSLNKGNTHI